MFEGEEKPVVNISKREFSWKRNYFKACNGYLETGGMITNIRVPLYAIETVVWTMNPVKPTFSPTLKLIGKGIILAELEVTGELINDIQDWLLDLLGDYSPSCEK